MQFNSYIFILVFMPVTTLLYFLLNKVNLFAGKALLIIASLFFYAYTDWKSLIILGVSVTINYLFALLLERKLSWRKIYLFLPVAINVGLLLYFKYFNFAVSNIYGLFNRKFEAKSIILLAGVSFFTFQQIAYIVAIYKKEIEKAAFVDYLAYILYFPKILMGPLVDPVEFIGQINDTELKKVNWDNISYGLKIFCFGLFKKIMLADTFANAVSWAYSNIETATSMDWILVMLFYTFEIYFDFSGYSDMAVGTSLMMNITLPINFDSPYKAITIRDFWKRWHISLTKFLTKYIYIPLGGGRKGKLFTYANIMIVFLISGIWHGANWTFILWGLLHGLLMVSERIFEKKESNIFEPARWVITFGIINILWLLFRSDSIEQWYSILKTMIFFEYTVASGELLYTFELAEMPFLQNVLHLGRFVSHIRGFWMLVFVFASFGICLLSENNYRRLRKNSVCTMIFAAIAFIWAFLCLSKESVFVYFNF